MKKTAIAIALSLVVCAVPAKALFGATEKTTLLISGLSALVGDGQITVSWSASPNSNGEEPEKFIVYSGTESVADGTATEYSTEKEVTETETIITDLVNDTPVYVAVKAIGPDGEEGPLSDEISITPVASTISTEAPTVVSAKARTKDTVAIEFSEDIVLPEDNPQLSFLVTQTNDESKFLLVWSAEYDKKNKDLADEEEIKNVVVLQTDEQIVGQEYKVTVSAMISDVDGNPIESGVTDSAVFTGTDQEVYVEADHAAADDTTLKDLLSDETTTTTTEEVLTNTVDTKAPADVTNFVATFQERASDFLIKLTWTLSSDSANEIVDQIIYHSLDKGNTWDAGKLLGAKDTSYETSGAPETEHTFKLTTRDQAGNESPGVIRSVRLPALPQTGPIALVVLGAGIALAGASRFRKK